jgi:hypothetical protein
MVYDTPCPLFQRGLPPGFEVGIRSNDLRWSFTRRKPYDTSVLSGDRMVFVCDSPSITDLAQPNRETKIQPSALSFGP